MQTVYMYFDDSGVLHSSQKYFVYAGYLFLSKNERDHARREYRTLSDKIKAKLQCEEVKSHVIKAKHKRALMNVLNKYESLSVCVQINRVNENILANKLSIHRYKDYVLKRCIKAKFEALIKSGRINPNEDIQIIVMVDNQPTASNGYYDLKSSIQEELQFGIHNFNYGTFHQPIFHKNVSVFVEFKDSKKEYLIQAADILANSIWCTHMFQNDHLRNKQNHLYLQLP